MRKGYGTFSACAMGPQGGTSYRHGIEEVQADISHNRLFGYVSARATMDPSGSNPGLRVRFSDNGKHVVLYDGPWGRLAGAAEATPDLADPLWDQARAVVRAYDSGTPAELEAVVRKLRETFYAADPTLPERSITHCVQCGCTMEFVNPAVKPVCLLCEDIENAAFLE